MKTLAAYGCLALFFVAIFTPISGHDKLLIIGFLVAVVVVLGIRALAKAAGQGKRNVADGVIAAWEHLRITKTELIEGYKAKATRHSLAGLTARVETSGTVVTHVSGGGGMVSSGTTDERSLHLTIEGPYTAIVHTVKLKGKPYADVEARKFAAALNMASCQLGPQPRGMEAHERERGAATVIPPPPPPPPPTPVPAGWYPDPTSGQLQRYWDGTNWTEHTAPRV
jgi:hypothetical protein